MLSTAAVLLVLRELEPRFWFVDDKRNQYLPVARDIGRRIRDGEFPAIDPNLGSGGNFALDLQYGLYEPLHLLTAVCLSYLDNFVLAGFVWALAYLLIFSLGTTCLTQRLGAAGPWAAAAGVSAATSGYVLYWLAPNWIPGLVSLAWLPWFWWAWSGRLSPVRCLAIAVFTYLVVAGGWPATWLMFTALSLGLLAEEIVLRDRDSSARSWLAPLSVRIAAAVGGLVPAVITVLPLLRAADYTIRNDVVDNNNKLVPNLADILGFASPTLHGEIMSFGDQVILTIPVYFAAWFGLAILWLVTWHSSLLRRPGLISASVACISMVVLTQAPGNLGPLRNPIRSLAGAQFFFVVAIVVLACAGALMVSRGRALGLGVSWLTLAWLTWARDPGAENVVWGIAAVGALLAALVVVASRSGTAAGVLCWLGSIAMAVAAFQLNPIIIDKAPANASTPGKISVTSSDWPVFASFPQGSPEMIRRFYVDGVGRGFQRLSADVRTTPGYSSIRQKTFGRTFCIQTSHGYTCDDSVVRLLQTEPNTGRTWVDLLGYRTVLVAGEERQRLWQQAAGPEWERVDKGKAFVKYSRTDPPVLAGRITHVEGEAEIRQLGLSNATQSYEVASPGGATLIFRDLFWPGYTAELDGEPLAVLSLSDILLMVELPPGAEGKLSVSYAPVSDAELAGLSAAGAGVVGVSMLLASVWRRRVRADLSETEAARASPVSDKSADVDRDGDKGEPDDGKALQDSV